MPPIETLDLNQKAVLWRATSRIDREGNRTVQAPVEINVQWDDTFQQVREPDGNVIDVEAIVGVDQDVPVHSIMVQGVLNNWGGLGTGSAGQVGPLLEVVRFSKISDFKGENFERVLRLARYKNVLPPVVET